MYKQYSWFFHLLRISIRTSIDRRWVSITSILSVTLVVLVLLGFLAMARGFENALYNTGSDRVAIFFSSGANAEVDSVIEREQYELLKNAPGVRVDEFGEPLLSPELAVVVGGSRKGDGNRINFNLRGLLGERAGLRDGFELIGGRMFREGRTELIVGRALAQEIAGMEPGRAVRLGGVEWTVVGVFRLQGQLFESEAWSGVSAVQSSFGRYNRYQVVRASLESPDSLLDLAVFNQADERLRLAVQSERDYFAGQSEGMVNLITHVGWPLAIVLSIGAFTGILNSMRVSVASRRREIRTLVHIGFRRGGVVSAVLFETLLFSMTGATLGIAASWWFLDGASASTFGAGFTTLPFALRVDWPAAVQGFFFALGIGLLAGILPAIESVRRKQLL